MVVAEVILHIILGHEMEGPDIGVLEYTRTYCRRFRIKPCSAYELSPCLTIDLHSKYTRGNPPIIESILGYDERRFHRVPLVRDIPHLLS